MLVRNPTYLGARTGLRPWTTVVAVASDDEGVLIDLKAKVGTGADQGTLPCVLPNQNPDRPRQAMRAAPGW